VKSLLQGEEYLFVVAAEVLKGVSQLLEGLNLLVGFTLDCDGSIHT